MSKKCIELLLSGLLLMPSSVYAQTIITPEQAVQAVRDFWGDQTISATVNGLTDEGETSGFGYGYDLEVSSGPKAGVYRILATSGILTSLHIHYTTASNPVLSLPEAQTIAEAFLLQHYPAFGQGQWSRVPEEQITQQPEYEFCWYPILNGYGVQGPYYIEADVDWSTGNIVGYFVPWDTTITGPTVPQITQQQAQAIASPHAIYDLDEVPFSDIVLSLDYDLVGIQRLRYTFRQIPPSTEENPGPDRWGICVDAVTGEITGEEWPLGGIGGGKQMRKNLPPLPRHVRLLNGSSGDKEVRSVVFPVIEKSRTWLRVELLRGFGARVKADRRGATVRIDGKMLEAKQLGAKWRDYGWWVPLRPTVESLGWKVTWKPENKEARVLKQ